ncbi:putative Smr domain-containing protein [Rosa chinensis]|uniref:Putative Smr domain-containing protein n=1 Tax=Rosa chinensis TaxID=74649 RepID=A0A2P6P8C9_ROSCH|nr:putative Smr domain-containing protein [Rosa chinensis]
MTSKTRQGSLAATTKEDAEQFLCSMFGDESEISLGVVKDVLGQCGCEVEKALDALLELSSSSRKRRCSSEYIRKNYAEVLVGPSQAHRSTSANLSQMVESLFNNSKRSLQNEEPRTMNSWKNSVKELQDSLGPEFDVAKGAEYDAYRSTAKEHWDSVKSYHQKAATAYSNGSRAYAGYLSEQAKAKAKLAREVDEKASQEIFKAKNKDKGIKNDVMTIDLHGQHVNEAMKFLKMHIQYGTNTQSLRFLRVITGHGAGKSIVKHSVIKFFQKEGIKWSEENPGALLIKLGSQRDYFRFMDRDVRSICSCQLIVRKTSMIVGL